MNGAKPKCGNRNCNAMIWYPYCNAMIWYPDDGYNICSYKCILSPGHSGAHKSAGLGYSEHGKALDHVRRESILFEVVWSNEEDINELSETC
jgi:hypothetical protein